MKPIIILTGLEGFDAQYGGAYFMLNMRYSRLVKEAGAIPVMACDIRAVREYTDRADGLLLTGGYDIHVGRYGQIYRDMGEASHFSATRDDMEFELCSLFLGRKKPVLGIGRGMQVLNVALGGNLCREIEQTSYEKHTDGLLHPVKIKDGSRLHEIFGNGMTVNSYHHQAVDRMGEGLSATAVTNGGVIEAVEHGTLPALGVQWHPERTEGEEREKNLALMSRFFEEGWG